MAAARRRRGAVFAVVLLLAGAAMTPQLREIVVNAARGGISAMQTFARRDAQSEVLTLPELEVYALQLGVYESGERAQQEAERLLSEGVPCVIWQRERMRLVCSASLTEAGLDQDAALGRETFVIRETLPEVRLRLNAEAEELPEVRELLLLPDALLEALDHQDAELDTLAAQTREKAEKALTAHPESEIYTQLAQGLADWCDLMDAAKNSALAAQRPAYAQVSICTLCRQLREALSAL